MEDVAVNASNGWELVGYSAFNGPQAARGMLVVQAKQVGAGLVLFGSKYTDTQNTGTVGSTTFTRYGAFSFAVPTSVRRYDQLDLFFTKAPHIGLGTYMAALKPAEHAALGTNKGMRVIAVVAGSPASRAEVLPGDIIVGVNGTAIYDPDSFHSAVEATYGKTADLSILRGGQTVDKRIDLAPGGAW